MTVTSPLVRVAGLLSVMAIWSIPNQGRSVVRPAGSSRSPSAAVWSDTVPAVPHDTETVEIVAALLTVRLVSPLTEPEVAVMVEEPAPTPVARPETLIVATPTFDEVQETDEVRFSVDLSENVPVAVNCSVSPAGRLVLTGVTAIDWSTAAVTVRPVEPEIVPRVADIVTGPGETAVANPVLQIVAQVVSEEAQVTWLVKFSVDPSDKVPVAVNCSVSPAGRLVLAGVTAIDSRTAAVTVKLVEPVMVPSVAEIVTGPGDTAVANPVLLIVAQVVSEEAQVTSVVKFSVEPSDNVPVAVNCSVSPVERLVLTGVTAIDWRTAAVTVRPVEPEIVPSVAEIVTGPGETAVANPVLLIVAHVVSEDAQVTWLVKFSVDLSENVPVAVNCSVCPGGQARVDRRHRDRLEYGRGHRQAGRARDRCRGWLKSSRALARRPWPTLCC